MAGRGGHQRESGWVTKILGEVKVGSEKKEVSEVTSLYLKIVSFFIKKLKHAQRHIKKQILHQYICK